MHTTAIVRPLCLVLIFLSTGPGARAQCPGGLVTAANNLVSNGDFSSGNTGFASEYRYVATHNDLPGGHYSVVSDARAIHRGFAPCGSDHTGASGQMLTVNGTGVADTVVWEQSLKVEPDTTYYFSTWVAHITLPGLSPAKLQFSINGAGLEVPFVASGEPCLWRQFFTTWHSGSAQEATISIVNQNTEYSGNDFALDDVVFYECAGTDLTAQLKSVKPGDVIELRNVFFDTDQTAVRPDSYPEIDRLARFLMDRPEIKISVAGHTDGTGSSKHNAQLSLNRAKAVCELLQTRGVKPTRCAFRGFGDTRPIDSNETYEGRQKNRRVEFSVLVEN